MAHAQQAFDLFTDRSTVLQIERDPESPRLIHIWEPLETKAPNPCLVQPYCCYIKTVIFYLRPYVLRPWHHFWVCNGKRRAAPPGRSFAEWDRAETVLGYDSIVPFEGQRFRVGGGRVIWKHKRWWMLRTARPDLSA